MQINEIVVDLAKGAGEASGNVDRYRVYDEPYFVHT